MAATPARPSKISPTYWPFLRLVKLIEDIARDSIVSDREAGRTDG